MNYNVVLVAGWAVFTLVWWFCGGRKRYTSPVSGLLAPRRFGQGASTDRVLSINFHQKFNLHTSLLEEQGGEELKR